MIIFRYFSLVGSISYNFKIVKITIAVLFMAVGGFTYAQTASIDETKKQAKKLFEEEEYSQAYKLFSQLVSNYPKDVELNYKLGVCMIYSEPDKTKCIQYLQFANNKPDECPKETKFFLAKAFHLNYKFDEAINLYNDYKSIGSSSNQKKLQVDNEINACINGKRLLSNLTDLVVLSKKQLNETDYFRSYGLKSIGGKLLAKPEEFKSSLDKRKKDKSVIYLPKTGERVYFSSYGDNADNGKDIYFKTKLSSGEYSKPEKVKGINTEFDEDFPFIHPNGNVLYFASKGHNSMGGFDIFKSNYVKETDSWTQPQNLEFPINSPGDDFLYITDSLEKVAFFSTDRQSSHGKIDVLKINAERKPIDVIALKGTVTKGNSDKSLKSKITVKKISNGELIGTYNTLDNGEYFMNLPNGAKLEFIIETPGLETQSQEVSLPLVNASKPFKQSISYDNGKLKIINHFDDATTDENYLQYLSIIENKAKLDVNEEKNITPSNLIENNLTTITNTTNIPVNINKNPTVIDADTINTKTAINDIAANTTSTTITTTATSSTIASSSSSSSTATTNLSNTELIKIAKQDAEESRNEALQLNQDANDAYEIGNSKKIEGDKKINEGNEALKNAQSITNQNEKESAIEKATAIKIEGENEKAVAQKILTYAKTLDDDAKVKIKEADLNKQYYEELEKVITTKNNSNESLTKLDNLQKQINELSTQKSKSDDVYNSIKLDVDEKEKQLTAIETDKNSLKQNLQELKTEITNNEIELENAKRKNKPIIQEKIDELKAEQIEKEKQIAEVDLKINIVKDELNGLNNELTLANKIKTEKIATTTINSAISSNTILANTTNSTAINTTTTTTTTNQIQISNAAQTLNEKYQDKILITDNTSKDNINQSISALINFNKEIDVTIANNKTNLTKAKTADEKNKLTTEINSLENLKKENQQKIATNNKLSISLNTTLASNSSTTASRQANQIFNTVITTTNNNQATSQLDNLNSSLNNRDTKNIEFNAYQNPNAQQLKIDADSKINDAVVEEKKLKEAIALAKDAIALANQNPSSTNESNQSPEQLNKDAEELASQSIKKISESRTKTDTEKQKLLNEAIDLRFKSTQKKQLATEVIKNNNTAIFDVNTENIQQLISENKSNQADSSEATKLNNDAVLAYNQAKIIRNEALSLSDIESKFVVLNNAQEKETEAISKQLQAIDILRKSNPTANLKTANTSVSASNSLSIENNTSQTQENLIQKLNDVNKNIEVLADTKIAAYQRLYEANKAELEQITAKLKNNETIINTTPVLKTEYISDTSKIATAETLIQNSNSDQNKNDKLNSLINATKKQIEAINKLNELNNKVDDKIAKNSIKNNPNNNPTNPNTTLNNNDTLNKTNTSDTSSKLAQNKTKPNNTTNPANNSKNNTTPNNNINNYTSNVTVNTPTIDANTLATNDTTAAQTITYLETTRVKVNNPQANALITNALNELKKIEKESKQLEDGNLAANTDDSTSSDSNELKAKADELFQKADELNVQASNLKLEAATKPKPQKDNLLTKAKKYENESNAVKLEASNYNKQAFDSDYDTNNTAISGMLSKLKNENPNLASEIEEKNKELLTIKTRANELRNEANNQTNTSAKIGGLGNAEEKEAELLQKQNNIIKQLKKNYPDYVVKSNNSSATSPSLTSEEITQKQNQLIEKQNTQLTNLANAFSLEFETTKNYIPTNLNAKEIEIKNNADDLSAESKRLLISSTQQQNQNEKTKLLTLAAKTSNAALQQLNLFTQNKAIALNNPRKNNTANNNKNAINSNNTNAQNTDLTSNNKTINNSKNNTTKVNNLPSTPTNTTTKTNTALSKSLLKVDGLEISEGNAYNESNPIPVDEKIPDGLIFRVQIGAFKTKLPNDAFLGLSPLNGETAGNGYIRYTAGNFNKLENASAVKNDLRNLGYNDAFVVIYNNGKRISLNEALALIKPEIKPIDNTTPQTAGITATSNIPKVATANQTQSTSIQDTVVVVNELEQIKNMLYTIQIGVYTKKVTKQQLKNLNPIYTVRLPNGLYRYNAGIYNSSEKINTDKLRVNDLGIKDAFVRAYLDGKQINFTEAINRQKSDSLIKMEPENPIIFSDADAFVKIDAKNEPITTTVTATSSNTLGTTNITAFKNNITNYPVATPENGIKTNEDGICFKVQIGAYSKQISNEVVAKYSEIKNWPIENKQYNGLFIYNIGNFSEAKFANNLKEEAIRLGIKDAFISVYQDGKKLYGTQASDLINK